MKKWTIVIEIDDTLKCDKAGIEELVSSALFERTSHLPGIDYAIMETIEAPYGPELPGGVYLDVREGPKKVRR